MTSPIEEESRTSGESTGGRLFPRATLVILCGAAALSFVGFLLLGGFGERLSGPVTAGPGAYSVSALGHAALVEFLRGAGVSVVPRRDVSTARPSPRVPLILVEPGGAAKFDEFFAEARDADAPVVLVLPKRFGIPDPARPRWVAGSGISDLESVRTELRAAMDASWAAVTIYDAMDGAKSSPPAAPALDRRRGRLDVSCRTVFGREMRIAIADPQLLGTAEGVTPLVTCDGGALVALIAREDGELFYVIADPDLLSNHGLGAAEHASIAEALFSSGLAAHSVIFDETIHGLASRPGLIEELVSFPLVIVTLHAILLAGLGVWAGVGSFGRPRAATSALAPGKEALIECAAQLAAARRLAGPATAEFARARLRTLARTLGLTGTLVPGPGLADRIDEVLRARRLPARARGHWNAVELAVSESRESPSRAESAVLDAATALHDWTQEIAVATRRNR